MVSDSEESMRAAVYRQYGGAEVVRIEDIARPLPQATEILIKVHATTVSSADWRLRSMTIPKGFGLLARIIFGLRKPKRGVLGTELSGVVAAVGSSVSRFKVGDEVIAYPGGAVGAHAEYRVMNESASVTLKSPKISFEVASALGFGGLTALFFLRDGAKVQRGERVLIIGASGAVGSSAVQIARHFGAKVTAVCSGANLELVRSIGADDVIDYQVKNWKDQPRESFDIIFDTVGQARWRDASPLLKPKGRLLLAVMDAADIGAMLFARKRGRRIVSGDAKGSAADLAYLNDLAVQGEFKPVIEKVFDFEQIVDAHRLVDSGRKKGSVVVSIYSE